MGGSALVNRRPARLDAVVVWPKILSRGVMEISLYRASVSVAMIAAHITPSGRSYDRKKEGRVLFCDLAGRLNAHDSAVIDRIGMAVDGEILSLCQSDNAAACDFVGFHCIHVFVSLVVVGVIACDVMTMPSRLAFVNKFLVEISRPFPPDPGLTPGPGVDLGPGVASHASGRTSAA